jgi:hypothetical protein
MQGRTLPKTKAAAAVADVEEHAAFAGLGEIRQDAAVGIDAGDRSPETVGADVACPQLPPDEFVVWPLAAEIAEVDHGREVCQDPSLDAALHRHPVRKLVMGGLDPHDLVGVLAGQVGRPPWIHVVDILPGLDTGHAKSGDVDEGVGPGGTAVEDAEPEIFEVSPAGAAGVDHGGHAAAEAEAVGQDAVVAGPGVAVAGRGVEVDVDVDETRNHEQAGHVHDLGRLVGRNGVVNGGDLAGGHGHILWPVDTVLGVNDAAPAEEKIKAHGVLLAGC